MSQPTIRVEVAVAWDAGTDSADDDRQIRAQVDYPNDSKAVMPDVVARKLAEFISAMSLPVGTGPKDHPKRDGATVDAETAAAIRKHQQAQSGSVSAGRFGVEL